MHEIIHLSFGTQPNHVHSHFYNAQASYFVFTNEATKSSHVDPHVLFREGKGFTPRALIWDMNGGFGSMAKNSFMYKEEIEESGASVWDQPNANVQVMKQEPVRKLPYRQLIEGIQSYDDIKMNVSNTLYWSDYLNIVVHPKSLLTIPNWTYDPIKFPRGKHKANTDVDNEGSNSQKSGFSGFDTGVDEFENMNSDGEYLESHFRPILEQCDSLSGLNISVDTDTAWGGLASTVIQNIRDDYFTKGSIFTWAFHDKAVKHGRAYGSRVKTIIDLASNSSLYIPLAVPTSSVHPTSNWFNAGLYNLVFESYSVLSSLRGDQRISMDTIASQISEGTKRNIVDIVAAGVGSDNIYRFDDIYESQKKSPNHVFAASIVERKAKKHGEKNKRKLSNQLGIVDIQDPWTLMNISDSSLLNPIKSIDETIPFSKKKMIDNGTSESQICTIECPQGYPGELLTYPSEIVNETDDIHCTLQTSDRTYNMARDMSKFSKRAFRGDEGEQICEDLGNLAEQYRYEMNSDEEYD